MTGKAEPTSTHRASEPEMLDRYYSTLRVKLEHVRAGQPASANPELVERLDRMLADNGPAWKHAYEIHELMTDLLDEDMLDLETDRALAQGERFLQPESQLLYSRKASEVGVGNVGGKRTLLRGLLADLHWRKTLFELGRRYLRSYRARVGILCLVFLVGVLTALTGRAYYLGGGLDEDILNRIQGRMDIFYLLYASLVGIWGATFSMLTGVKVKSDEMNFVSVRNMYSWSSIVSRIAIGAGGGLLMYFFIKAEMITGGIMPNFAAPKGMEELVSEYLKASQAGNGDLMKSIGVKLSDLITSRDLKSVPLLTVWAFIAGFSEKLVPGLLSRTQSKVSAPEGMPRTPVSSRQPATLKPAASPPVDEAKQSPGNPE